VGSERALAASANRTTPYMPSWSVRATTSNADADRLLGQLLRMGGPVEETRIRVTVQLPIENQILPSLCPR
jgi:hypothetical protein